MKFTHDVIVIGGGAAGLTAAGGCALFGLNVALIEGGKMGGECLNNGCVPSKAIIAAAKRAQQARMQLAMGVTLAPPQISWAGVHKHIHDAIAHIEPHDSQERFEEMGCQVIRERATITGKHSVEVGGKTLTAPRIVIATGSKPALPPIKGLANIPYLTNENLFDLGQLPGHLIIIGGGAIGMEMGQSFRRLGSEVTVINPGRLMGRDDPETVAVVAKRMAAEGVIFVNDRAEEVTSDADGINVRVSDSRIITGTHLLIAAGRRPNIEKLGLEKIGIDTNKNGVIVDARRRSSVKSIYAIGDCRDGPRLTHVSGYEGSNVALEITTGLPTKVDWKALPWCTYTDPEVAQIGYTEMAAREKFGDAITVIKEGFDHNERAIAEGASEGFLKLILKGKKVIGASIVGQGAGELLLPWSQSITGKSSTFAMGSAIIAYPTRSEIVKAAAFAAWQPIVFGALPKKYASFLAKMRRAVN